MTVWQWDYLYWPTWTAWGDGYERSIDMIAHIAHLVRFDGLTTYKITRKGIAQSWLVTVVKAICPVRSLSHVTPSMVIMCPTWLGMTRRFVWNVSKPSPFKLSVRYWLGGARKSCQIMILYAARDILIGIWKVSPMIYLSGISIIIMG